MRQHLPVNLQLVGKTLKKYTMSSDLVSDREYRESLRRYTKSYPIDTTAFCELAVGFGNCISAKFVQYDTEVRSPFRIFLFLTINILIFLFPLLKNVVVCFQ